MTLEPWRGTKYVHTMSLDQKEPQKESEKEPGVAGSELREGTERQGARFGAHRVIEPKGLLPQPCRRVDNDMQKTFDNEVLVDVVTLNIDAASFRQMEKVSGGDVERVVALVRQTVLDRGKQHNPVTNSGGMLLGTVARVGSRVPDVDGKKILPGERIATLASLSLTPLRIDEVLAVRSESAQLDIRGQAIISDGAPFARMPSDLPERLALSVLDVAGAAIQVERRAKPGAAVAILGAGGKSGILCAVQARKSVGPHGKVIGLENHPKGQADLRRLGVCDAVISADATDALSVYEAVVAAAGGEVDLCICCVNVEGAEMGTILPVRDGGCAYFFSMSTSFGRAALGAEGVGKDIELIIGNGFARGHAEHALQLVREHHLLREILTERVR